MSTATIEPRPAEPSRAPASRVRPREGHGLATRQSPPTEKQPGHRGAASHNATDDEILSFDSGSSSEPQKSQLELDWGTDPGGNSSANRAVDQAPTSNLEAIFAENPELRRAWEDASAYRNSFATPDEARAATSALADLDRMDALFFSGRHEDHAELARAVAALDPAAFKSLVEAMSQIVSGGQGIARSTPAAGDSSRSQTPALSDAVATRSTAPVGTAGSETVASMPQEVPFAPSNSARPEGIAESTRQTSTQEAFFHSTNEAAVRAVIDSIESQVQRLLPEGISKGARNRVVGEIYRELDATLRSNRQLAQQTREAFRSGSLDNEHQAAIVSLITGRARQALPGVAKRVLNEWTSTIVAANQDRRARQRTAERRIDIAGSGRTGNDGRRPLAQQDIDYARMSDADILNL